MDVDLVPATQALAEQYFEGPPPYGFKGYIALDDGRPVGVGGLFWWAGLPIVFSHSKGTLRENRREKVRCTRFMEGFMDKLPWPVYAVADPDEPTSAKLLSRLGFVPTGIDTEHGELLVRRLQNADAVDGRDRMAQRVRRGLSRQGGESAA